MASKGDEKLLQPISNDNQETSMPKRVKGEHPHLQPPENKCPGSILMPSEIGKYAEQVVIAHPADDTEIELTISITKRQKHSEGNYKVYGKPNDSVYTTLMKNEVVQNELKKQPEKEMKVSTGQTPKVYVNLGMPLKCLKKDTNLHITFIKSERRQNNEPQSDKSIDQYKSIDQECFTFCISAEGRGKKIITKLNYGAKKDYLSVYGIKGETIYDALSNDSRFLSWVTQNDWTLVKEGIEYVKNTPVEKAANQKFDVIVKKTKIEISQKGHKERVKKMTLPQNSNSKEQIEDLGTTQEGAQSTSDVVKFLKPEMAKGAREPIPSGSIPKESKFRFTEQHILKIYHIFTEENNLIRNFFQTELANAGGEDNKLFNLHLEKYGKVTEDAMTSKTFKTLASLADSIGYIHLTINGRSSQGTCFVFWDRYILTCQHVITEIINIENEPKCAQKISEKSFVTFTDENPNYSSKKFGIEPWLEVSSKSLDYVVLKLKENEVPKGLFKQNQNTELPRNGTVFIIGHPEGEVKKIDICTVIPLADREKQRQTVLEERQKPECNDTNCVINDPKSTCIHAFSAQSFHQMDLKKPQDIVTYDSSFFDGSSGSPVLDVSGQLVAMHAAGYKYYYQNQKQSVIEYGFSINSILNDMKQNHESWYNSLFPYQQDVEMVNASDSPPRLIFRENASGAY